MLCSFRDSPCIRRTTLAAVVATLLAAMPAADPALACSIQPEHPGDGPVDPSELRLASVDGEDLLVDIDWDSNAPASMELRMIATVDGTKTTVATWGLVSSPGGLETVRLDGALASVSTFGFTYGLRLIDDAGVAASTLDFALATECPESGCRYRLLAGVGGADLPRMPGVLWAAFEAARADGVDDLFGHVRARYPDLVPYLDGFLYQLATIPSGAAAVAGGDEPTVARKGQTIGDPSEASCSCSWVQIVTLENGIAGTVVGSAHANPPNPHLAGVINDGAGHSVAGQTYHALHVTGQQLEGTTEFGIGTFCTSAPSGSSTTTHGTGWGGSWEIVESQVESCNAPCTPAIEHVTSASVCALGLARAGAGANTYAEAWAAGSILLDGQFLAVLNRSARVDPDPQTSAADQQNDYALTTGSRTTTNGLVTITGAGTLDLSTDNPGGVYEAYALGATGFGFRVGLVVPDGCPGVEPLFPGVQIESRMNDGNGQGGAVLRSWENFP
ncbi:MAG: hypothetical protein AAGE94_07170 [Acidobacteriota bacterium]